MPGSIFFCAANARNPLEHPPLTSILYHSIICKICYNQDNMGNYAGYFPAI